MKIAKPDLNKFKDILKKNIKIYSLIVIAVPLLALLFYYLFPGNYSSTFKIQFTGENPALLEEKDTKKILLNTLSDTKIFSPSEASYFTDNFEIVDEGRNIFRVISHDTVNSRLQRHLRKACDGLRDVLGKIPIIEIPIERKRLQSQIESDNNDKIRLEEELNSINDEDTEKLAKKYENELIKIEDEIEPKQNQLAMIETKINSFKTADPKLKIFRAKAKDLNSQIEILMDRKSEALQKLELAQQSEKTLKDNLERLVHIEENIEKNLKRLDLLGRIESDTPGETVKLPYSYSVNIIEPPTKSKKIFAFTALRKAILIGLLISFLVIATFCFYYLTFNPIISSVTELEKLSGLPVLGAIHEIKKS